MNAKNNLWEFKDKDHMVLEILLFAAQIIIVIFLLNASIEILR